MVGVTFFCKATKILTRLYGDRSCEPERFNKLIELLGAAEQEWKDLPPAPAEKEGPENVGE